MPLPSACETLKPQQDSWTGQAKRMPKKTVSRYLPSAFETLKHPLEPIIYNAFGAQATQDGTHEKL